MLLHSLMSEPNPWDQTIWDPIDPEQAIEDPMHGPSAVHDMLQTPAMPCGDGTYYQPGAYYTRGTAYVDSQDRPVYRIGGSTMAGMRESFELKEWLEAHREGDEALTALEAERQQARLEETGFAHTYKPFDVCPGGKRLEDCETGNTAYQAGLEWAAKKDKEESGDGTISNVIAWAGSKCVGCSVSCEVAVKTVDGKPQETRVSFYKPDPNMQTIRIDLGKLKPVVAPVTLEEIRKALGSLGEGKSEE
jgi:hypothetical protein